MRKITFLVFLFLISCNGITTTIVQTKNRETTNIANYQKEYDKTLKECGKQYKTKLEFDANRQEFCACVLSKLDKRRYEFLPTNHLYPYIEKILNVSNMPSIKAMYYKRAIKYIQKNMTITDSCDGRIEGMIKAILSSYITMGLFNEGTWLINKRMKVFSPESVKREIYFSNRRFYLNIKEKELKKSYEELLDTCKNEKKFLDSIAQSIKDFSIVNYKFIPSGLKTLVSYLRKSGNLSLTDFDKNPSFFLTYDDFRFTSLNYLLCMGNEEFVLDLLKNREIDYPDKSFPLLLSAILSKKNKIANYLLTQKSEWIKSDFLGLNWITYAIVYNNFRILEKHESLVRQYVNEKDIFGNTPIFYAIQFGNKKAVEFLVKCGAKIDIKNNSGYSLLDEAIISGEIEIIDYLCKSGLPLDGIRVNELYRFFASHRKICKLLNFFKAYNIKITPSNIVQSLNYTVDLNEIEIAKCLLKNKVDFSYRFNSDETIFFSIKTPEMAELLLSHLDNPKILLIQNKYGFYAFEKIGKRNKKAAEIIRNYMKNHGIYEVMKNRIEIRIKNKGKTS